VTSLGDALRAGGLVEVIDDAGMADLTTLRVGGAAAALVTAHSVEDLVVVSHVVRDRGARAVVLGRGSNLLVSDEGWDGVVVRLGRGFRGVIIDPSTGAVEAGAAEPLPALAVAVAEAGLVGFAWAVGVPGTVGGAVRMNAGAHGRDMADDLVAVDVVRLATGEHVRLDRDGLALGYRSSALGPDDVVVRAHLAFAHGDRDAVRDEMTVVRDWRREHQPINEPNCGSVFTNPPGSSAGALIEAAGLKGARVGRAEVSERHANFVVTRPGASADDVARLIDLVRARVLERTGVELRDEVVRLGDFAADDTSAVEPSDGTDGSA